MLLSIVIVNYNVKYLLEQCLRSVREAAQGIEVETWVVDNASTDGSVDYLRPLFPEVHFIENADNPGFAKANNQAIRFSRGRYVLLLNPDTIVTSEALRGACHFMDSHTNAGAIGVKMINGHGAFLPESKRSFPTPWVAFCKLSGPVRPAWPHTACDTCRTTPSTRCRCSPAPSCSSATRHSGASACWTRPSSCTARTSTSLIA